MKTKVLQVFYNENGLPFKDQARTVHFPITGSGFQGASNTTQIKFYFSQLGDSSVSWVAVAKLPNGKVGSKVLETYSDSELGEPYALLELNSFYTQYKGDVFISLQGYEGGVEVTYDDQTEVYEIDGTPTIQATGSIKFTNNYATQFVGSGEEDATDLQELLALLGLKANKSETISRYTSNFSAVTLQTLYDLYGYKLFILNTGSTQYIDYLMQFQVTSGSVSGVTLVRMTDLREWHAEIGSGAGQLALSNYVSALQSATYLKHITTEEYLTQYYVPYTGANADVDLGIHNLTANSFQTEDIYSEEDLFIGVNEDLSLSFASWFANGGAADFNVENTFSISADSITFEANEITWGGNIIATQTWVDNNYVSLTSNGEKVYGTDELGNQMTYDVDSDLVGSGAIVRREAGTGTVVVGTPTSNTHATTKQYTDNTFVKKVNYPSELVAYTRDHGIEGATIVANYNLPNSIVRRRADKTIQVGTPSANDDATTKKYVDDAIAAAVSTLYEYKGSKTVAELNTLTGQTVGDTYNVSDAGTLTAGNVQVLAGDNVVWDGFAWDKLAGTVDLTGYYTKVQVDALLLQKATISETVMDTDLIVSGGFITQISRNGEYIPIAQNVAVTTIPKVVQSTTDLPGTNDGYLYLVLDNGYLYNYVAGTGWTQAYQYTSDLLTITEVTVEED